MTSGQHQHKFFDASTTQAGNEALPQFAHVAIPVHLRKLFTYRLPPSMQRSAQVGSRVMVQLGAKATAGYIVELIPRLRPGTSLTESEIKDVQELLDIDPPLTPEVLEITRWVADYYAAPWGEVMRAALPAGINANVEQTICWSSWSTADENDRGDGDEARGRNYRERESLSTAR